MFVNKQCCRYKVMTNIGRYGVSNSGLWRINMSLVVDIEAFKTVSQRPKHMTGPAVHANRLELNPLFTHLDCQPLETMKTIRSKNPKLFKTTWPPMDGPLILTSNPLSGLVFWNHLTASKSSLFLINKRIAFLVSVFIHKSQVVGRSVYSLD